MKTLKILLTLGCVMFISLTSASATTVMPMDLQDITANAELIFIGTVSEIRSQREAQTIYTYVTFADLQVLKGTYLEGMIEVRLWGGSAAGETMHVFGMPKFVVGEENLIFLAGNFQSLCPIVGWGQGRFKIRWDEVSGEEMVFDDSDVPVAEIRGRQIVRAGRARGPQGSPGAPAPGAVIVPEAQTLATSVSRESFISAIETMMGIGPHLPAPGKAGER